MTFRVLEVGLCRLLALFAVVLALGGLPAAQDEVEQLGQRGSIRGVVYDREFQVPLAAARVEVVETGLGVEAGAQGNYVLSELPPGVYTLVFSKEGYVRLPRAGVVVRAGELTELDVQLAGDYTDMPPYVVDDVLALGTSTEAGLLDLRLESAAQIDSVGAELMSKAGASDAASALRLVAGATVQDGKFAVVRGLPDRYVSSQLNGVRMPSADEDKRAVELDQFPAAVIDSIQVAKTFTPDQQGDASGGAVNVKLKGVPTENTFEVKAEYSYNSNVGYGDEFLTYDGGGVGAFGSEGGDPQTDKLGESWSGAVGTARDDAPLDYKLSLATGGKRAIDQDLLLGGFLGLFYERDSSFFDDGISDSYWSVNPGDPLTPEKVQGEIEPGGTDYKTSLFDVTQGTQSVQWGGLGILGVEGQRSSLALTLLYSHTAEDTATLAEDTRGKEFFFPGYDPSDPTSPGTESKFAAPYLRTQTLAYTERDTGTLQLHGDHTLPFGETHLGGLVLREPELDWTASLSFANLDQPDKRQFSALWYAEYLNPGIPGILDPFLEPAGYEPYKPSATFSLGNLQRIWKTIEEDSAQVATNLKWPLERWGGEEGYLKAGFFADRVDRAFDQDSFSNFNDSSGYSPAGFDDDWSDVFSDQSHPITASERDVDYDGEIDVTAYYAMVDLPLTRDLSLITGARFETTEIGVVLDPEEEAVWYPLDSTTGEVELTPGAADVDFDQDDVLPMLALVYDATDRLKLRASYSRTIARQTFKELTPVLQQEYLGAPIFVGNPDLGMSSLDNYDLRLDYVPYEGGLWSASWFHKDVEDAIEYVQEEVSFTFTTAKNYPEGRLDGFELEARQDLDRFWDRLAGLSVGGNATWLFSEVKLPADDANDFVTLVGEPITERDMTFAPEHLYNLYVTYDFAPTRTQLALFYTITGDTLVAGAGESKDNFIPDVYAKEYGTLNLSLSQPLGRNFVLKLQAKNLTDPEIEEVYRSDYVPGGDVTRTSYTRGREFSIGLSYTP